MTRRKDEETLDGAIEYATEFLRAVVQRRGEPGQIEDIAQTIVDLCKMIEREPRKAAPKE